MISFDLKGCEEKYRPLLTSAINKLPIVITSPEFLNNLIREINSSNNMEGELSPLRYKSARDIYEKLLSIDLYLNTYYTRKDVLGYGYKTSKNIHLNTKYLSSYSIDSLIDLMKIGSNILHEHTHKIGAEHDFYDTKRRKNSLSYIMNRVYEKTYRELYGLVEETPVVVVKRKVWYKPWTWF